jgi:dTDP-glucose pyrophosphorylase
MINFRTIIPCAGLGTRMNMPPNQSKELLPDPKDGRPLIEWTLDHSVNPLLIIRKEKMDLINYCNENGVQYIVVGETREWPETILAAKQFWGEKNLLLLPDTRFDWESPYLHKGDKRHSLPWNVIHRLNQFNSQIVFGTHHVEDVSKWGEVALDNPSYTQEKPKHGGPGVAWGFIGFNKSVGTELFANYLYKTKYNLINNYSIIELSYYKDLTRNGKVEDYG